MMLLLLGLSWQALLAPHLTKGSSSRRHLKRASSSPPTRVEERDSRVIRKRGEKALRYCSVRCWCVVSRPVITGLACSSRRGRSL